MSNVPMTLNNSTIKTTPYIKSIRTTCFMWTITYRVTMEKTSLRDVNRLCLSWNCCVLIITYLDMQAIKSSYGQRRYQINMHAIHGVVCLTSRAATTTATKIKMTTNSKDINNGNKHDNNRKKINKLQRYK